jgi:hypothetical protein
VGLTRAIENKRESDFTLKIVRDRKEPHCEVLRQTRQSNSWRRNGRHGYGNVISVPTLTQRDSALITKGLVTRRAFVFGPPEKGASL